MKFHSTHISYADAGDKDALIRLLNKAYRGEGSKKGWTTEADLLEGDVRTDENEILSLINRSNSVFLRYTNDEGALIGCVNLQQHAEKIYLGMLAVDPEAQAGGIGRKLLIAAEEHARKLGCHSIYMSVISVRPELISWYDRNGYKDTGERKPFLVDQKYGTPTQDLVFIYMEKQLS